MASNPTFKVCVSCTYKMTQYSLYVFQPSEGKREEFRRYLEKTGVMDALTKVLVSLYEEPEKPNDALQYPLYDLVSKKVILIVVSLVYLSYIQNKLALQAGDETIDSLKTQLAEAQEKIETLEKENAALKGEPKVEEEQPQELVEEVPEPPPVTETEEKPAE